MSESTRDLSIFKKAQDGMIAKNSSSWNEYSGRHAIAKTQEYTEEEIMSIIDSGTLLQKITLSRNFFARDGFYKRILMHYATILKYNGILIPNAAFGKKLSNPRLQKQYFNAMAYVDKLNLPEIFTHISIRVLVDGSYYGLIQKLDKSSFVLMDLPAQYCCSRYKDFDGNDIIEFNVSYFNTITDMSTRKKVLKAYPNFISNYYKQYLDGKAQSSWTIIPSEYGVCFSLLEDGRPMFLTTIPAIMKYDDAVDIEKERELEEIKKIITLKVPHTADGTLVFEPEEAEIMHAGAVGMLKKNKNISVLTTYCDAEAIVSKTSSDNYINSLDKMMQNVYSETGASMQIFAPTGTQALSTSIENDIALMMVLCNKYSRFISFIINTIFSNYNISFKYTILPISYYNQSDYVTDSLKLAQSGYSFLLPSIAMDIPQSALLSLKELENDVLDLSTRLIPLASSYTQSTGEVGAPKKDPEDKSIRTIQNEESLDHQGQGGVNNE